jgi:hypothetical protein
MRCGCCAQYVRQPRPIQCRRAGSLRCARPPHRPRPYRQMRQTTQKKIFPDNAAAIAAHRAKNDQRTPPYDECLAQNRRIVVQALAASCRPTRTARGRTSAFAGRCCSACSTKPDHRLSGWKGELALRCVVTCLSMQRTHACPPLLCAAQHCVRERTLRCRWQQQLARDVLYTSTRGCNRARAQRGRPLQ